MCSRDKGCVKSCGECQVFYDMSGKNGIYGLNYDICDGIKKVFYYSKCIIGRYLIFCVILLMLFIEIDILDVCFMLLCGGNK